MQVHISRGSHSVDFSRELRCGKEMLVDGSFQERILVVSDRLYQFSGKEDMRFTQ
jgi:hypothetical protein